MSALNAWVLHKEVANEKISRRTFIRKLAEELAEPQVKKRNGGPGQAVPSQTRSSEHEAQPKNNVQVKIMCKRNRSVGVCIQCKKSLCGTCTMLVQSVQKVHYVINLGLSIFCVRVLYCVSKDLIYASVIMNTVNVCQIQLKTKQKSASV